MAEQPRAGRAPAMQKIPLGSARKAGRVQETAREAERSPEKRVRAQRKVRARGWAPP